MYKFIFYVPVNNAEQVKSAVFMAGAGKIGNYDCCSWETLGKGQFRPLDGSAPYLGNQGEVEVVSELKVELVCSEDKMKTVLAAFKQAHPYEEPAYQVFRIEDM